MTPPPETLAALAAIALLAALAAWLKRGRPSVRRLAVVESAQLGQGRMIAVVQAGSKRLLIGASGQSIAALAELDAREWPERELAGEPLRTSESEAS